MDGNVYKTKMDLTTLNIPSDFRNIYLSGDKFKKSFPLYEKILF